MDILSGAPLQQPVFISLSDISAATSAATSVAEKTSKESSQDSSPNLPITTAITANVGGMPAAIAYTKMTISGTVITLLMTAV
ncbi:hypothetical protein EYZ11_012031 [Aspergillus tanneri]|uniref:Uncharacterized protein n=1 Tax=Aspergillus tanneri TaxID=1220188 RepID=A0A4S3J6M9_9EURO|nr:hypothetical protein EYZ11_012031 [Aspergillus tanneri]